VCVCVCVSVGTRSARLTPITRACAGPHPPVAKPRTARDTPLGKRSANARAHLELMGVLAATFALPQYLMTAMLEGAVCVALIEPDMLVRHAER
jgi:hypothetical protein